MFVFGLNYQDNSIYFSAPFASVDNQGKRINL